MCGYRARWLLVALLAFAWPGAAVGASADDEIKAAVAEFLDAFTSLDWERFRATFTDDATVFLFPMAERTTVEGSFGPLFEFIRGRTSSESPPYFRLEPLDVDVKIDGDAAIVTFHLRLPANPEELARRTFVMLRGDGEWRIAHLHASSYPERPVAPTP